MKNVYYLVLVVLLCTSCRKSGVVSGNYPVVVVDLRTKDVQKDSSAFTSFSTVKLEVTDESLLADIAKVVCHNDRVYVLSTLEPTLFIFDKSGKYQSKLAKGQGPGEVTFVSDMAVYHDTLYVLDGYRSIKSYNLDGTYIKEKAQFDYPYFSMSLTQSGIYLLDPNINRKSNHNLHFITSNGEEKTFLPKNKWFKDVSIATYNSMRDGYIVWPLSNIVYKVEKGSDDLIPACLIDFKGKWIDGQEYKSAVTNEEMWGGSLDKYARWLKDFIPLKGGGFFFSFKYDQDYFVKYINGSVSIYANLLAGLPKMKQAAVGSVNDSLIYTYTPEELREYNKEFPNQDKKILRNLYTSVEEEDLNPILFFVPVN